MAIFFIKFQFEVITLDVSFRGNRDLMFFPKYRFSLLGYTVTTCVVIVKC